MKGLPERIVLAVIILSCGFVAHIGSTTKSESDRQQYNFKSHRGSISWLPSDRQLKTIATLSLARNH